MKRIWTLGASLVALLFTFNANAGIYIEPKIDYSFLTLESTLPAGSLKGSMVGARLGYSLPLLTLALDYSKGDLDAELGAGASITGTSTRTGATLIFAPPILPFNVLVGYFNADLDTSINNYSGDGTKLGVMFTMLPFININLEYFTTSYDKDSLRDKGLMAGLSIDLDI